MKKFLVITFIFITLFSPAFALFGKNKDKPVLILSSYDPRTTSYDEKIENYTVYKSGSRIYFMIYSKKGFKSQYLKYQIVKQDDNAHEGGYSRVRGQVVKINDPNQYIDYFVLNTPGKYFLQVFDITNLSQWLAIGAFRVVNE